MSTILIRVTSSSMTPDELNAAVMGYGLEGQSIFRLAVPDVGLAVEVVEESDS